MFAVVQSRYGSLDQLSIQDIPLPIPGDDEVLIRVHAAGAHIGDVHLMAGTPFVMRYMGFGLRGPKAKVRGMDLAGTVESVGARVSRFRVGDVVYGSGSGSFAEFAVAKENALALKPASLSFEEAAAIPTSACTALNAIRTGNLQSGQRVLIIGASGGVGLFAVQIARAMGATVVGVSSAAKMDLVRRAGAVCVYDYASNQAQSSGPYDLIIDMASTWSLGDLRRALNRTGTLVVVGGEGGGSFLGGLGRSLRAVAVSPFVSQQLKMTIALTNAADLEALNDLIEAGNLRPVIDRAFTLNDSAAALRYLMSGRAAGKVVITNTGDAPANIESTGRAIAARD